MTYFRSEPSWQRDKSAKTNAFTIDPLAVIYNEGHWKLSKVSPMLMLEYDTVKLKQYAAKIRQSIASSVAATSTLKYTVNIEEDPSLKYSEDDAHGLVITIFSTNESKNKSKLAYSAVFLSWGNTALSYATHLPYMLERGEQKIGAAVKMTLQSIVDCNIKEFTFTQHQLLQIAFNFLDNDTSRDLDKFSLVYKTPNVDHKEALTLSFTIADMRIIWNGAKEEATKPTELMNVAYQLIQQQIFHMLTLDVSVLDLMEVSLPKAEVKSNGILKMNTPEHVNSFFTVLNEICASLSLIAPKDHVSS